METLDPNYFSLLLDTESFLSEDNKLEGLQTENIRDCGRQGEAQN